MSSSQSMLTLSLCVLCISLSSTSALSLGSTTAATVIKRILSSFPSVNNINNNNNNNIKVGLTSLLTSCILSAASMPIVCNAAIDNTNIYYGVGCFWHVQHEFVDAEHRILGRDDAQLSAKAGYAGGKSYGKPVPVASPNNIENRLVCYHNILGVADYGKLGHGEVVGLNLPEDKIEDFTKVYFSLFGSDGDRPDKGDRGKEYRSLVGLPGGVNSKYYAMMQEEAAKKGITLKEGTGDDADTLGKKVVWVMDTKDFPFNQAEVYHQFHDGFMPNERYPQTYNSLQKAALDDGRIHFTGCPDLNS